MNDDYLSYLFAALMGFAAGLAYFWSLWLTVQHAMRTRSAAIVLASGVIRMALLLIAVWFATSLDWRLVAVCLAGLLAGRQIVFTLTTRSVGSSS
ncbi:MAG: ATP synthase subunit I [Planctomycetaceae bacterium]